MIKEKNLPQKIWWEKALIGIIFGGVTPICFFLCGWWGSYLLGPEKYIPIFAFVGLGLGLFMDVLFLRRWLHVVYYLHPIILIIIYLFYSIAIFGFFMGVPVFNTFLGPLAGFYTGRRIKATNSPNKKSIIRKVSSFTAFVLAVACLAALFLAANEQTLSSNINGMLAYTFGWKVSFNNQTILLISILMGTAIVVLEYILTRKVASFGLDH